jgi:hypothetical protein
MKESLQKIVAWAKEHPWLAAGIVGVVILLAWWASRSSGGGGGDSGVEIDAGQMDSLGDLGAVGDPGFVESPSLPSLPASPSTPAETFPEVAFEDDFLPLPGTGWDGAFLGGLNTPASLPAPSVHSGYSLGGGLASASLGSLQSPSVASANKTVKKVTNKKLTPSQGTTGSKVPVTSSANTRSPIPVNKTTPAQPKTPAAAKGYPNYYNGYIGGVLYVYGYPITSTGSTGAVKKTTAPGKKRGR